MENVLIKPVETRADLNRFFNLPRYLYRNDNNWVEPLRSELNKQFDRKRNPFFKHGDIVSYIALRDKKVIGRITAIQDTQYNSFYSDRTGFFGFFECINDESVAKLLFEKVEAWIRERELNEVVGPLNFTMFDGFSPGAMISGFDTPPFILMSHNPPYYKDLVESAGYTKAIDVLAFRMPIQQEMDRRIVELAQKVEKLRNIRVRFLNPKNFWHDVEILKEIFNSAWQKNWGFVPLSDDDFEEIVKSLKKIYIKELVQIAEIKGEPVGWAITLPNINEALIHLNGRLFPLGIFKLMYWMGKVKGLRLWGLGIKPEYRRLGVDSVLYYHTLKEGKRLGYTDGELSWIMESNTSIVNAARYVKGEEYKRYRIFQKSVS
jgi:ribosomal protein S18 acetylase RimI-like enzyme